MNTSAFFACAEVLLRADILNRYIIPLPTQVAASFGRLFAEEDIAARFLLTFGEAIAAGILAAVIGTALGVLLYKVRTLRLATESWIAAAAAAPVILAYPLFLVIFGRSAMTIIVIGAVSGLAPTALKTLEELAATRRVDERRSQLKPRGGSAILENSVSRSHTNHCRRNAARADLLLNQHRRSRAPPCRASMLGKSRRFPTHR